MVTLINLCKTTQEFGAKKIVPSFLLSRLSKYYRRLQIALIQSNSAKKTVSLLNWNYYNIPASVTQLDVHPTGDQEVAGSTPAGTATFFRGD